VISNELLHKIVWWLFTWLLLTLYFVFVSNIDQLKRQVRLYKFLTQSESFSCITNKFQKSFKKLISYTTETFRLYKWNFLIAQSETFYLYKAHCTRCIKWFIHYHVKSNAMDTAARIMLFGYALPSFLPSRLFVLLFQLFARVSVRLCIVRAPLLNALGGIIP